MLVTGIWKVWGWTEIAARDSKGMLLYQSLVTASHSESRSKLRFLSCYWYSYK